MSFHYIFGSYSDLLIIIGIIGLIFLMSIKIKLFKRSVQALASFLALFMGKYASWTYIIFKFYRPDFLNLNNIEEYQDTFPDYQFVNLVDVIDEFDTGDILLLSGNNNSGLAIACKWANQTPFSHMAFIFKQNDGNLYVIEASGTTESVRKVKLMEKFDDEYYSVIAWRKLNIDRTGEVNENVNQFVETSLGKKHDGFDHKGLIEMIKSSVDVQLPLFQRDLFMNYRNSEGYFCSELVADLYMKIGLLPDDIENQYPDANEYTPGDFTNIRGRITANQEQSLIAKLSESGTLEKEKFILNDKKTPSFR